MSTKRISELPLMEEVTENLNILVEDDGETKRIPASSVGGAENPATNTLNNIVYLFEDEDTEEITANMTFDEIRSLVVGGNSLIACKMNWGRMNSVEKNCISLEGFNSAIIIKGNYDSDFNSHYIQFKIDLGNSYASSYYMLSDNTIQKDDPNPTDNEYIPI